MYRIIDIFREPALVIWFPLEFITKLQNDCFILQPRQLCSAADCSVDIAFTLMLGNMAREP